AAVFQSGTHACFAMEKGLHGGKMFRNIQHDAYDSIGSDYPHALFDAVFATFVQCDVIVFLVDAVVGNLGYYVTVLDLSRTVGDCAAHYAIRDSEALQLLPQARIFVGQLLIDFPEMEVALPGIDTRISRPDEFVGRIDGRCSLERIVMDDEVYGK